MQTRVKLWVLLSIGAILSLAGNVSAGPLAPRQQDAGPEFFFDANDPSFAGDTLASRTTPFELTIDVLEDDQQTVGQRFVRGTVTHYVVRESTGRLAFHYDVRRTT